MGDEVVVYILCFIGEVNFCYDCLVMVLRCNVFCDMLMGRLSDLVVELFLVCGLFLFFVVFLMGWFIYFVVVIVDVIFKIGC